MRKLLAFLLPQVNEGFQILNILSAVVGDNGPYSPEFRFARPAQHTRHIGDILGTRGCQFEQHELGQAQHRIAGCVLFRPAQSVVEPGVIAEQQIDLLAVGRSDEPARNGQFTSNRVAGCLQAL